MTRENEPGIGHKPELSDFWLSRGAHGDEFISKACVLELSNLIAAGVVHVPDDLMPTCQIEAVPFEADHPSISRPIRAYIMSLNDQWDDEARQHLRPYAARVLCTATGRLEDEERRAWMAADWLIRTYAPTWLRRIGEIAAADALSHAPAVLSTGTAWAIQPALDVALATAKARAEIWVGDIWPAMEYASWWGAAWGYSMWPYSGGVEQDVAREAEVCATQIASAAIQVVISDATDWATAAYDATEQEIAVAARKSLRPTVVELQTSALQLLDRMIDATVER